MTTRKSNDDPMPPSPESRPANETANQTAISGPAGARRDPAARRHVAGWVIGAALCGAAIGSVGVYSTLRMRQYAEPDPHGAAARKAAEAAPPARKRLYRCPMHPAITSDKPGVCPICGMTLVLDPVEVEPDTGGGNAGATTAGAAIMSSGGKVDGLATVSIDPQRQQMIGLRTARAARAAVTATWRTVGRVEVDPTRVRRINVKVESYVERVLVDFVGKAVRQGQPLMTMYSPSLLAAQDELLLALKTQRLLGDAGTLGASGTDLVAASRRKLELWDVPPEAIERLIRTGVASKNLTLVSPIAGVVTAKNVVEGGTLRPGDTPYEITDLRMVWLMADAYESDITRVRIGMPAMLTLGAYPNRVFAGKVEFIDPLMDASTRTTKVHVHVANPSGELKPEMFGEVVFRGSPRMAIRIPSDAVIQTGNKNVVFLALGAGKFGPREVRLGARDGEFVEVTSGLTEGQEVVTRANFLVDSESRLRASLASLAGK